MFGPDPTKASTSNGTKVGTGRTDSPAEVDGHRMNVNEQRDLVSAEDIVDSPISLQG